MPKQKNRIIHLNLDEFNHYFTLTAMHESSREKIRLLIVDQVSVNSVAEQFQCSRQNLYELIHRFTRHYKTHYKNSQTKYETAYCNVSFKVPVKKANEFKELVKPILLQYNC